MKLPRSLPTGAWIAVGLITAALVVPGTSLATATITQIVGSSGGSPVAGVDKANQLLTGPSAPSNYFTFRQGFDTDGNSICTDLGSVPAGKAAIITDFRTITYLAGSANDGNVFLYTGPTCSGTIIAEANSSLGITNQQITPGFAVPAGTHLSYFQISGSANFSIDSYIDGYSVPSAAVTQIQPTVTRHALNLQKP